MNSYDDNSRGQEVKDEVMEEEIEELKKKDNEENVELEIE